MRVKSIDIFRALTMWLMIFVNDLWSLRQIPGWLEHKPADVDGMGLADVVFPAFLFIVGLSIPLAVKAREDRGDQQWQIIKHIGSRSIALIIMGFFMVNLENINAGLLIINKYVWQILMTLSFYLIWNVYRDNKMMGGFTAWIPKLIGIGILILLAVIYQSGTQEEPMWMQPHWWGILGLIGWSYLISAIIYVWIRDRWIWIGVVCLVFYALNVNEFIHWLNMDFQLIVSASNYALVMTGVLTTVVLTHLNQQHASKTIIPVLIGISVFLLIFGFVTRPEWGISKIYATPSWTALCAGVSLLFFVLLYLIVDRWGQVEWASFIGPAGSSTLTCYLIPYFVYAGMAMFHWEFPEFLSIGSLGLVKSLLYGLIIIQLAGGLNRYFKVKLKV